MENGAGSHIEIPEACSHYTHKTLLRHKQQQMNEWMNDWPTEGVMWQTQTQKHSKCTKNMNTNRIFGV